MQVARSHTYNPNICFCISERQCLKVSFPVEQTFTVNWNKTFCLLDTFLLATQITTVPRYFASRSFQSSTRNNWVLTADGTPIHKTNGLATKVSCYNSFVALATFPVCVGSSINCNERITRPLGSPPQYKGCHMTEMQLPWNHKIISTQCPRILGSPCSLHVATFNFSTEIINKIMW